MSVIMFSTSYIQEACKQWAVPLLLVGSLQFCGNQTEVSAQLASIENAPVPYQNSACSTQIKVVNADVTSYTLGLLSASFTDESTDEPYVIQMNEEELVDVFDSALVSAGGFLEGTATFDLQNANLTTPIQGSIVMVGISGPQVAHFIGNFTCE